MRVWLDDLREPIGDWVWLKTPQQFEMALKVSLKDITEISFDHDLGDRSDPEITGYTCICWIEKLWYNDADFVVPILHVHSANPVGRAKIQAVINKLNALEGR